MKKPVALVLIAVMILGSIKAMALTDEEFFNMNQNSKIEAVMNTQKFQIQKEQIRQVDEEATHLVGILGDESMGSDDIDSEDGNLKKFSMGQLSSLASQLREESQQSDDVMKVQQLWESAMQVKAELRKIKRSLDIK